MKDNESGNNKSKQDMACDLAFINDYSELFEGLEDEEKKSSLPKNYVSYLGKSKSIADFEANIATLLDMLNIDTYTFAPIACDHMGHISSSPPKMFEEYLANNMSENNWLMHHAERTTDPIFMSSIFEYAKVAPAFSPTIETNRLIEELLCDYSYFDYYNIPMVSVTKGCPNTMLSISKQNKKIEAFRELIAMNKQSILMIADAISYIGETVFSSYFGPVRRKLSISDAELRALEAVIITDGPVKKAADKLNLSVDTVNSHLASVRRKFGVSTTVSAVYRAIKDGIIQCDTK